MPENLLKGKVGIITGALDENSIAWKTALKAKEQGAKFVLTNAPIAMRMGAINELAKECDTIVIPNIRKGRSYGELNYDWLNKSYDVSAISFHKMMHVAEKMDVMKEWGSIVGLSYIAAQRVFPFYTDMADAKALLESIARGYGYRFGKLKKVRVNTISQSPTKTTAGTGIGGFDSFFNFAEALSPLGNASADACADYIVTMFSDLTKMVTMQNLFHDGGYSFTGISEDIMEKFKDL